MSVLAPIAGALREHRRAAFATVLLVAILAAAAYLLIPHRYTVDADVWLDHGLDRTGTPVAGGGDTVARNTEIRVLTSTDLIATVVDRLGLGTVPGIGQPQDGPRVSTEAGRRAAIAALRDRLEVSATGTSYAVSVGFSSADPVLATAVVNRLADAYVEDRRIGGVRGRERQVLRAQVSAARDMAIRSDAAATGYRSATDLIRRTDDARLIRAELAALDTQAATAQADERAAVSRLVGDGAAARIRDLQEQRAALPAGAAIAMRLSEIDRAIAGEAQRIGLLNARVRDARARLALIRAARTRAAAQLTASEQAAAALARLDLSAQAARTRYTAVVDRYNERLATQRTDRRAAYVISRARPQAARAFPNATIFAIGGLLAAIVAAGVVVAVLEWRQKGFRTRTGLERAFGLPVIGMVPDLARTPGVDLPADDAMAAPDYLYNHHRSAFSAAFREIHTGLRLGRSAHSPRVVAVCSALPEEGKTTVSICLARSAAMAGLRVVLVDCDARRPAASRALIPYVRTGLAEVLEDGVEFRQAIQCDTPSGAWFLPHTTDRALPGGAVSTPAMATLLTKLKREFDLVILDTPPALALAEAREVSAMADSVLLVARHRKTPADAVAIARDLLDKAGAPVTATALTMVFA